jgi:hypothetical protein
LIRITADAHFTHAARSTLVYVNAKVIMQADRSTMGFLRLLTIPLLLVIDLALGYRLEPVQIVGIGVMFHGPDPSLPEKPAGLSRRVGKRC